VFCGHPFSGSLRKIKTNIENKILIKKVLSTTKPFRIHSTDYEVSQKGNFGSKSRWRQMLNHRYTQGFRGVKFTSPSIIDAGSQSKVTQLPEPEVFLMKSIGASIIACADDDHLFQSFCKAFQYTGKKNPIISVSLISIVGVFGLRI
jgi:hypothetical protein